MLAQTDNLPQRGRGTTVVLVACDLVSEAGGLRSPTQRVGVAKGDESGCDYSRLYFCKILFNLHLRWSRFACKSDSSATAAAVPLLRWRMQGARSNKSIIQGLSHAFLYLQTIICSETYNGRCAIKAVNRPYNTPFLFVRQTLI